METFRWSRAGNQTNPAGQSWPQPEPSRVGRVIEPRNNELVGADAVRSAEGSSAVVCHRFRRSHALWNEQNSDRQCGGTPCKESTDERPLTPFWGSEPLITHDSGKSANHP